MFPMPSPAEEIAAAQGLAASIAQVAPWIKSALDRLRPLIDQPVIRFPWSLPLASSAVIPAGQVNQALLASDFQVSLEWPFEVHAIKFSQDPSHTFRDWRVAMLDQSQSQLMQNQPSMVAQLVDNNTGKWMLEPYPWVIMPKGGGLQVNVTNLDTVNPITVDISFIGYLLMPKA